MLMVVEVCLTQHVSVELPLVEELISIFLLDLYGIPLHEAVQMRSRVSLLEHLTSPSFGKRFSHREVAWAMCSAAERGDLRTIQKLFDYDPLIMFTWSSLEYARRVQNDQPFDVAAYNGHTEVLRWLYASHPRACTQKALEAAASQGHVTVIEFLLEHRICHNAHRALEEAASRGHLSVVKLLAAHRRMRCAVCVTEKAAVSGHFSIVQWLEARDRDLCSAKVESTSQRESQPRPLTCTARHRLYCEQMINAPGHEEIKRSLVVNAGLTGFKWLAGRFPGIKFCVDFLTLASRYGDVELVKWLLVRTEGSGQQALHQLALEVACSFGQFEVVKMMVDRGYFPSSLDGAVASCNLDLVKHLLQQVDQSGRFGCLTWTTDAIHIAVTGAIKQLADFPRCIEMIKLLDPGASMEFPTEFIFEAAKTGNLDLLQFFLAKSKDPPPVILRALGLAIANGHLGAVKWLYGRMKSVEEELDMVPQLMDSFFTSGWHGRFEVIRFILSHEPPGENDFRNVILKVVEKKDLQMLQFLHSKKVKGFADFMMQMAASVGSLRVVRFLHEQRSEGCTKWTIDCAATEGFLHIVKFIHANRPEQCCTTQALDQAACNGHLQVVKFLHHNRKEGCTVQAMDRASANGHLVVVRFLHENRHEGCSAAALVGAVQGGHLEVAQFLVKHREEVHSKSALEKAHSFNRSDIERWFIENHQQSSHEEARAAAAREVTIGSDFGRRLLLKRFLESCLRKFK